LILDHSLILIFIPAPSFHSHNSPFLAKFSLKLDHLLSFWYKIDYFDFEISGNYWLTGFGTLDFGCISFLFKKKSNLNLSNFFLKI